MYFSYSAKGGFGETGFGETGFGESGLLARYGARYGRSIVRPSELNTVAPGPNHLHSIYKTRYYWFHVRHKLSQSHTYISCNMY